MTFPVGGRIPKHAVTLGLEAQGARCEGIVTHQLRYHDPQHGQVCVLNELCRGEVRRGMIGLQ